MHNDAFHGKSGCINFGKGCGNIFGSFKILCGVCFIFVHIQYLYIYSIEKTSVLLELPASPLQPLSRAAQHIRDRLRSKRPGKAGSCRALNFQEKEEDLPSNSVPAKLYWIKWNPLYPKTLFSRDLTVTSAMASKQCVGDIGLICIKPQYGARAELWDSIINEYHALQWV